uniref:Uncharacterized protein n=1 Tax=Oncorhynchus kisutch TaxID=8019 RepID=A0A8C7FSF9_ONCKI
MHCFPERKHTIYIFFQSTQPQQVLRQGIRIHHNGAWKFQVSYLSSSGPMAIYETLKNIDTLFRADDLPTTWDQQKLENFQNIVYHQIEKSKCMMGSVDTSDYCYYYYFYTKIQKTKHRY